MRCRHRTTGQRSSFSQQLLAPGLEHNHPRLATGVVYTSYVVDSQMPSALYVDPRVRRTREMLERSFAELLRNKAFEKISVGDIAEGATLNRATFYDHFLDKFDLLESWVGSCFQALLDKRGVVFDGTCPSALQNIALAVCDFLSDAPFCTQQRQIEQHLESAMVAVVRKSIQNGLGHISLSEGTRSDFLAAAVAGALYNAAKQWLRDPDRGSAEEMATVMREMVQPMLLAATL